MCLYFFFFNDTATTEIYTLSLHDALPISIRNRLLCSTKSAGGTASSTPVMPPMAKVHMKPTVHSIGTVKRMRPRYMVNSQLKILAPVGIEMIIVVMPKKIGRASCRERV